MININDEIKQAFDLSTTQVDKIILNNKEYRISNVEYYDDVYKDGNIFGTAIGKCLDFEIENSVNLEGKEVEYLTGIVLNGVTHWISLGNFIIHDIEPNDTTNISRVTAMDYMLKTNIPYVSTLNYRDGTVTLLDVLQEVCNNSELTLATVEFANSNFIVDSNQFEEGILNRQVIQAIAQISGTVAKIKNNSLYLVAPNFITTVSKVFTLNNYEEAEIKRTTQPINLVSLGMADIEGENVVLRDEASISKNGENSLVINDNPFAYTQAKREQLITALFDAVKGFEYKAYSFKCQGLPYLETMDKIQFLDKEGNTYDSYVFRFNYKSPKGLESTIEAPSIIKATVAYQNVLDAIEISKRTEILVDKQNQIIQSVVSQTDAQNQKISEVTQTVNELNSKIGDIADITTSKESTYAKVEFEKINQSEPIYIKVHPIKDNISYLYPRENLYPSDDLFMTVRTLRFTNTTTNEYIDYELPTDLLYYDAENYDEFILDYDALSCEVNKRVGYNADGTTHLLDSVKTIKYDFPRIELTDGDYTISLLGYSNAYLFVRLMAQNYYTTQFATKAEMNSEISQTAEKIELSTDKKLSNYSTTTEMNAAISVKANEINSTVSETYSTKTETATAKTEAINSANTSTDNKLKNYSTTSQMNSAINQTASNITSTVSSQITTAKTEAINSANSSTDTKLKNYSTTTQMNSAIEQKADSITSSVAKTYTTKTENTNTLNSAKSYTDTQVTSAKSEIKQTTDSISSTVSKKVGYNEIISKINQSAETVGINATKVNLSATDILNLLAGNQINLTSQNIVISSKNFNVDKDGNITIGGNQDSPALISRDTDIGAETSLFPLGIINEYNGSYACISKAGVGVGTINSDSMNEVGKFNNLAIQHIPTYNTTSSSSANLRIDSAGYFYRATGSSKRWKKDITEEVEERLNPEALYKLPIKQFKYKEGYLERNDKRYNKNILGFIAEDVQEIYEPAVEYDEEGNVEMWNSDVIIPAMLKLIQEQHKDINKMQNEIKELKKESE